MTWGKMNNAIKMMESKMKPESIARSRAMAEHEILTIKLGQLREKLGVKNIVPHQITCPAPHGF